MWPDGESGLYYAPERYYSPFQKAQRPGNTIAQGNALGMEARPMREP